MDGIEMGATVLKISLSPRSWIVYLYNPGRCAYQGCAQPYTILGRDAKSIPSLFIFL
jgi:hypothetical protein